MSDKTEKLQAEIDRLKQSIAVSQRAVGKLKESLELEEILDLARAEE